jgi:hypothetical protein
MRIKPFALALSLLMGILTVNAEPIKRCNVADRETKPCSSAQEMQDEDNISNRTIYVADFGARCDGSSDDTATLRAAAMAVPSSGATLRFPKGICATHGTIYLKSKTHLVGDGTTLTAGVPFLADHKNGYALLENIHYDATVITDTDISVSKMTFDYGALASVVTPNGGKHAVRFDFVRNVAVVDNVFRLRGAEDAIAGLGVENMQVQGNSAYEFRNCAYDFWFGSSNVRVVGNYAETTTSAQIINFNPERTNGDSSGQVAQGFIMSDNTLVVTGTHAAPVQIEPLGPGTIVRDVSVIGNKLQNVYLVLRGDVRRASIADNRIANVAGGVSAFETYPHYGRTADSIIFSNNLIIEPQTVRSEVAVIRIEALHSIMRGNTIIGSHFDSGGFYHGKYDDVADELNHINR